MKRPEAVTPAAVDSVPLDAKGKEVLLECYPDGEILFWSADGVHLEFDRRQTALIIAALRKQDKLPKTRDIAPPSRPPLPAQDVLRQPLPAVPRSAARSDGAKQREPNRRVAREGPGWGATVFADNKTVRYYYDKRDRAREAEASHRVGEAGRIA